MLVTLKLLGHGDVMVTIDNHEIFLLSEVGEDITVGEKNTFLNIDEEICNT